MRLKKLDIYGYKSFATRCTFEFGDGITAIVGPNGSGKSNVADAVRWVLGEQSYRQLRAHSSEDMIFAGTSSRSRLGMAEVVLTFDNTTGWLPIDYSEVTVARRAYRSGENEYLLNGNRVRYRDVADLLATAGMARSSYLIIGQGMVDAALALRPEARRALFEEAAGIAPHLRKRADALADIAETERNLDRVQDILNELRPRADTLSRQAERAEEHLLLRQDLGELQRIWYGFEWQRLRSELAVAEEQLRERRRQHEAQREYARACQGQIEQLTQQEAQQAQAVEQGQAVAATLRSQGEELRRGGAVASERQRLYQQQLAALRGEEQALDSRQGVLAEEIARAEGELEGQRASQAATAGELELARQQLAELDRAHALHVQALAAGERRLAVATRAVGQAQMRLEDLHRRGERTAHELAEVEGRLSALQARLTALDARTQEQQRQATLAAERQQEALVALATAEQELTAARQQWERAEQGAAQTRAERGRWVARREALERVRQDLSGYHPGVRQVLARAAQSGGILGTVANLMQVPQEYEVAIEAALGSRLQNLVAERWDDAEAAIAHLKQSQAGWATFLPLDTLRAPTPLRPTSSSDVLGVGSQLVRYEERLRPVYELLLGRILVVRDLPAARRMLRERTGASLLVTLEGETVQPSGALSGGARSRQTQLLAQEREWRALPAQLATAEAAAQQAAQSAAELQARAQELQGLRGEGERRLTRERQAAEAARAASATQAQELGQARHEMDWLGTLQKRAQSERDTLARQEQALRTELATHQAEELAATQAVTALREQIAQQEDRTLRQRAGALETRLAVEERTLQSQERLLASHRENSAQLAGQLQAKRRQVEALERDLAALMVEIAARQVRWQGLEGELTQAQERIAPAQAQRAELAAARRAAEQRHTASLERLREVESELNQTVLQQERAQGQQEALAREVESDLGPIQLPEGYSQQLRLSLGDDVVELPEVAALPAGLADEIRHLRARLRRLGDVNPEAPHEYAQLLERQTFLQTQASDLRGAIASLHEVIAELDAVIERDFVRTVEAVDVAFREYFAALFNGGSARLVLTAPDEPSVTGVEIIAHPPGKRAQQLSLLSGGERALTAVALLFALLRVNPVPFSFLDEVDAALDEANVGRFRELLLTHARQAQFVVITHNRHTIDAAETIYGISMGEQGVSQSVSIKVAGAPQPVV